MIPLPAASHPDTDPARDPALVRRNARIAAHPGLAGLPTHWQAQLTRRLVADCQHFLLPVTVDSIVDSGIAAFRAQHVPHHVDLTASDGDLADQAQRRADRAALLLGACQDDATRQAILQHTCKAAGVAEPSGQSLAAQVKRLSCPQWWRRQLRRQQARALENGNVRLHYVHAKRDPYASREALLRCLRQEQRNRLWMENTVLENDQGDRFTLQELAEKSTSNKAVRRAELMTRIRGMEDYASAHGDTALFATITCPSAYHATLRATGQRNPAYAGYTPRQAQDYLCQVWSRIRAQLERAGIAIYGLRVAEPHHDGCPHWHLILFVPPQHAQALQAIVRHYALAAHPDEAGAEKNRCHFVAITAEKGSATGYVAKYIAKNIDGYQLETDITGEPAITASLHVTAWAKTHGIRQFQAFGAGSVMVWRELRRIPKGAIAEAPDYLQSAWQAAQKTLTAEGETEQRADYAAYLTAVGGVAQPRKEARLRLAKLHDDSLGKYGEALGERPIGVIASEAPCKVYASTRYTWSRVEAKDRHAHNNIQAQAGADAHIATDGAAQAQVVLAKGRFALPWTRVNNYTQAGEEESLPPPFWMQDLPPNSALAERRQC